MADELKEFFGKKSPAVPKLPPAPDFYGFFSSSPKEARKKREQTAKDEIALEALYAPYRAAMPEYMHHPEKKMWQFWNDNLNVGYKFHLNVLPKNVQTVSAFLKKHNYVHKYLNGGEVESGKVFTVYTGSKQQTELIVKEIADSNIMETLQPPPHDTGEIPYAPNIVGRFVGGRNNFMDKVAVNGITLLSTEPILTPTKFDFQAAFARAHNALQSKYGDYYGGGITYYQPQVAGK